MYFSSRYKILSNWLLFFVKFCDKCNGSKILNLAHKNIIWRKFWHKNSKSQCEPWVCLFFCHCLGVSNLHCCFNCEQKGADMWKDFAHTRHTIAVSGDNFSILFDDHPCFQAGIVHPLWMFHFPNEYARLIHHDMPDIENPSTYKIIICLYPCSPTSGHFDMSTDHSSLLIS